MKKQKLINDKTNKNFNPKMLACIFGLITALWFSWSFIKMNESKEITKTYILNSFPVFKSDASYFMIYDSVAVIDYKNYSLYEFADIYTVHKDTTILEKKIVNRYFLHRKKELYGYYYNSLEDKNGKRMKMDSLLTKRAYYNQSLFDSTEGMELITSQKNIEGYELIEKYKCETKIDITYPDTVIVYYSNKLKNVSFTLSKIMDSVKKMKVQKTRAIYNSQFIQGYPNKFPTYEYRFELKEDNVSNLEKYKRFIDEKRK